MEDNTNNIPAMGCPVSGTIPSRIGCILSYGGSTRDLILNYALLMINCMGCWALLPPLSTSTRPLLLFGFVWIFQIGLCLALAQVSDDGYGCAGISIVWCAMAGWMWKEQEQNNQHLGQLELRKRRDQSHQWRLLTACNVALMAYYAVTEEVITTVAHACALIMGALLSWVTKPKQTAKST